MAKAKSKGNKVKKKRTIEYTPFTILIWGVVSIFILGWIFVLGILVGRGFLPTKDITISGLAERLSKQPFMAGTKEPEEEKKPEPDPKLAFYEKLSSKKNAVKKKGTIDKKPEVVSPKKSVEQKTLTVTNPSSEKKEVNNIQTSNEKRQPSAQKAQYTVQLASLGKKESAESMIKQLIDKGHPAYYYMIKVNENIYYRIRCGKFNTMEEATDYADRLEREEGIRGFVSRFE